MNKESESWAGRGGGRGFLDSDDQAFRRCVFGVYDPVFVDVCLFVVSR